MSTAPVRLRFEVQRDNGATTLLVEGDLEEISAVKLARACLEARDSTREMTLDLRGVDFADGTGTKMLGTIQRAFERSGRGIRLVNIPACVEREVRALELDRELHLPN